jgi:BMFP domain-containing protein YqiC
LDVALKNALERIEQLEARLAALENKSNWPLDFF